MPCHAAPPPRTSTSTPPSFSSTAWARRSTEAGSYRSQGRVSQAGAPAARHRSATWPAGSAVAQVGKAGRRPRLGGWDAAPLREGFQHGSRAGTLAGVHSEQAGPCLESTHLPQPVLGASGEHQRRALGGAPLGHGRPNATAGAGDQDALVLQQARHGGGWGCWRWAQCRQGRQGRRRGR